MVENVDYPPPHMSCLVQQLKHLQFTVTEAWQTENTDILQAEIRRPINRLSEFNN